MSNLSNELYYESFDTALDFGLAQFKKGLNTALPGIVKQYDATTKRAQVLPAVKRVFTTGESQSLPLLNDIPVIFPSAGGFTITLPIQPEDTVLLVFTQRGITHFKQKFTESLPGDALLSLHDAVALVGFGALNITPASASGATMQNNAGSNAVMVESEQVKVIKGANHLTLDDSKLEANVGGATLTLDSAALVSSVGIFAPSFSGLAGGVANMVSGIDMGGKSIANAKEVTANGKNLSTHIHDTPQGPSSPPK